MKIPLLDIQAQHAPIRAELDDAIRRVLDHGHFIMGPEVGEFEAAVAAYCGVKHAVGVSSGTDALLAALMALEIKPGDEVIVPDYSFFATAGVVSRLGAVPVFVDIDPITFNIDPTLIEPAITKRTRAIVPVHLFGQCADMEPILAVARKHGLPVVEDAAQAIGARYKDGRQAGTMGSMGCLSFFPSKNLGAIGDAGMVITNDDGLAERLRILRNHGAKPKYHHRLIGGNFRLDTIQAAVLLVKLRHLDGWTVVRRRNARMYAELIGRSGLDQVIAPKAAYRDSGVKHDHIYNQFVIRTLNRDGVKAVLQESGIGAEVYYPVPFHQQECFRNMDVDPSRFPQSIAASKETLAIPIGGFEADALAVVVDAISSAFSPSLRASQ